jgi:hypothetical protein
VREFANGEDAALEKTDAAAFREKKIIRREKPKMKKYLEIAVVALVVVAVAKRVPVIKQYI